MVLYSGDELSFMGKISAGSYDLNKWLYGGYESDIITTVYGPAGSGKTNFCLLAAVSQAYKGKRVLFIDTEGGFSVERVKQLAGDGDYNAILERILVLKPTTFAEQKEAFKELLKQVTNDHLGLIIVDGMTMLYRLDFGEARGKTNGEMQGVNSELARQMRILAEIARKQGIPIIVTNQIYNWNGGSKMVAGDILQYWSKCLIELTNDNGRRVAHLRKHRSLPEKKFEFVITNEDIKKRGWL